MFIECVLQKKDRMKTYMHKCKTARKRQMVWAFGGLLMWIWSSERRLYSCLVFIFFPSLYLPANFSLPLALWLTSSYLFLYSHLSRPVPDRRETGQRTSSDLFWSDVFGCEGQCTLARRFWTTALTSFVFNVGSSARVSCRVSSIDPRGTRKHWISIHHPSVPLCPSHLHRPPSSRVWRLLWAHPVEIRRGHSTLHQWSHPSLIVWQGEHFSWVLLWWLRWRRVTELNMVLYNDENKYYRQRDY